MNLSESLKQVEM